MKKIFKMGTYNLILEEKELKDIVDNEIFIALSEDEPLSEFNRFNTRLIKSDINKHNITATRFATIKYI